MGWIRQVKHIFIIAIRVEQIIGVKLRYLAQAMQLQKIVLDIRWE